MSIEIHTFRKSFRDLEVGDQFFVIRHGWESRHADVKVVERLTDKYFIWGYGDKKPSGLYEYQDKFSREDGRKLGGSYGDYATLPTPELVAELNAEAADRKNRLFIRDFKWKDLTNAQAEEVCALLQRFNANTAP